MSTPPVHLPVDADPKILLLGEACMLKALIQVLYEKGTLTKEDHVRMAELAMNFGAMELMNQKVTEGLK